MATTITKRITDMSIYGITGTNQWDGSVVVTTGSSINVHGRYFPTRKEAEAYAERLIQELNQ